MKRMRSSEEVNSKTKDVDEELLKRLLRKMSPLYERSRQKMVRYDEEFSEGGISAKKVAVMERKMDRLEKKLDRMRKELETINARKGELLVRVTRLEQKALTMEAASLAQRMLDEGATEEGCLLVGRMRDRALKAVQTEKNIKEASAQLRLLDALMDRKDLFLRFVDFPKLGAISQSVETVKQVIVPEDDT